MPAEDTPGPDGEVMAVPGADGDGAGQAGAGEAGPPGPPGLDSNAPVSGVDGRNNRTTWWKNRFPPGSMFWPRRAIEVYVGLRLLTVLMAALRLLWPNGRSVPGLLGWDGAWFHRATFEGYPSQLPTVHGLVAQNPIAFFPGLPLLWRLTSLAFIPANAGGLLISFASGLAAVVAVGALAREMTDQPTAERAALLFAVFPGTFVFSFIYSDGLLVTFAALGLIALMRKRWLWAGLIGALATLTSPVGLAFVVAAGVASLVAILRHRAWRSLVAPALATTGFIAYMAYLWCHTGILNAWRLTERDGWHSYPSLAYPVRLVASFVADPLQGTLTAHILVAGTVVGVAGLVLVVTTRQALAVQTYAFSAIVLAAISYPVGLRPRFLMTAFPLIIAVATRYEGRTYRILVAVNLILLVMVTALEWFSNSVFP